MSVDLSTRAAAGIGASLQVSIPIEPVFTIDQVARHLQLDRSTVRRLFIDRPGVIVLGRPHARGGKRSYTTLRIPVSVLQKFIEERTR